MYLIKNMTRLQVAERMKTFPVAIVPIGSTEQHGPHLPLGTDTLLAEKLAGMVSALTGAMVFPSLNFGYSWGWRDIPGTISMPQEHLQTLLIDIAKSVERYGIRLLVFLNGHEANCSAMKYAVRTAQDETNVKLLGMFYPGMAKLYKKYIESPTWGGMFHACEFETSLMLAVDKDLVDMSLACEEYPERPALYGMDNSSIGDISQSGVYGNATLATREKGEKLFAGFAENIADLIMKAYNH